MAISHDYTEKLKEKKKEKKIRDKWEIDFKYNLKMYLSFLRKYWFLTAILLVIILIIESFFVLDKYLFKVLIDKGTAFVGNLITKQEFLAVLTTIALVFITTVIIRVILRWLRLQFLNTVESNAMRDLKLKFFNHIINLSHSFHVSHKTGSLITRILRGAGSIERMTDTVIFNVAPLIFNLIVVSISLIYLDKISALVLFLTIFVFIIYSYLVQITSKKPQAIYNEKEDIEKANLADFIMNIDSIKYFGKEKQISSRYDRLTRTTKNALVRFWNTFRLLETGQELILAIGTILLIYFPIQGLLTGRVTPGTVAFIYTVYGSLIGQVFGFVYGIRNYYRSMIDFESLFQYYKIEQEVKDKKDARELEIEKGEVEFKNITFKYGTRTLFKNLNLKVPKNKKIALVGHSGCGKTTLVKLLYRFYDVDSGQILIDSKDIRDFKQESLRSEMSIVPQECVLFDDTIYNNIAFSRPSASKAEVLEAMKFAQLDKIIKDFPEKENTIVGERGVKLSGGEKQRVSIARAILANKKILVLDEATSSLDSKTEHEIQQDLRRLMENRTTIIIAHRLSTIMHADEIIVMEKGKIVQEGNHFELIRKLGIYKELWTLQKGGYIDGFNTKKKKQEDIEEE
jgi:ATP-binding cassette subfamily B protein